MKITNEYCVIQFILWPIKHKDCEYIFFPAPSDLPEYMKTPIFCKVTNFYNFKLVHKIQRGRYIIFTYSFYDI